MSDFSLNLKRLMNEQNLTEQKLADFLGLTRQAVNSYCTGKASPKADTIIKLADYFGVSCDYLLTGKEKESQELGLSGDTIHYLKKCGKEELELINQLLSDGIFQINIYIGSTKTKDKEISSKNIVECANYGIMNAILPELKKMMDKALLAVYYPKNKYSRHSLLSEEAQIESASLEEAIKSILPPSAD